MASNKPSTPVASPKYPKTVRIDAPQTPPAEKSNRRLLALLQTPEQPGETLPFSPGLKRTNLGTLKLPDYKLNNSQLLPFGSGLLKTPRGGDYDSDDKETPRNSSSSRRNSFRLSRTPQFFSPGKRLFDESSPNKHELSEISTQLKSRLSLALGQLQKSEKALVLPVKLDFTEFCHTLTRESPTKKLMALLPRLRANMNLQTLQRLPAPVKLTSSGGSLQELKMLPVFTNDKFGERISIPSPDEESSAQSALLAAFLRLKERQRRLLTERKGSLAPGSRPTLGIGPPKLPLINMAVNAKNGNSEEDAVYSLMSLLSPQLKQRPNLPNLGLHQHSRLISQNSNSATSPDSLRSLSVVMPMLPPISGLIRRVDDEETDVEDDTEPESEDSGK